MFSNETGNRLFWSALAAGLVVRFAILTRTAALGIPIVDEQHYAQLASSILAGYGFAWGAGEVTSLRPPLYPALLASVWGLAGAVNLQAVRVMQVLLAAVTTVLVYRLGDRVYGRQVGRVAAAAFWLYPSFVFFNFLILTETLFTLLLVAFVLLSVETVQNRRMPVALACGAALGLGALARSVLWPVPLLLCPLLGLLVRGSVRRRLLVPFAVLLGYAVVITPWTIRNTRLQGVLTVVDTMGGLNMRMGNYEHTPEERMWDAVALTGEKGWSYALRIERPNGVLTEGQKEKWAQAKAIEYMLENPGQTLRRTAIRFADFWGLEREYIAGIQKGLYTPPVWFAILASAAILGGYVVVAIAGAAGIWLARPDDVRVHVLMLLPIVVIMGVHMLVFGHSRYHLPLIPILCIYGAALVTRRTEITWAQQPAGMLAAAATVCVLLAVWLRQILIVDAERLARLFSHA